MNSDLFEQTIQQTIAGEYERFRTEHPRLAAVVDEPMLAAGAKQSLLDDSEFHSTLTRATLTRQAAGEAADVVRRYVLAWIEKLW